MLSGRQFQMLIKRSLKFCLCVLFVILHMNKTIINDINNQKILSECGALWHSFRWGLKIFLLQHCVLGVNLLTNKHRGTQTELGLDDR